MLLEKIEAFDIEDVLAYNEFVYEKHEWDNIPGIVPRYVIYLSKYMNGICAVCKEFSIRENVKDLRIDFEGRIVNTNQAITDGRNVDIEEKEKIKESIEQLKDYANEFRDEYNDFTKQATKLTEQKCKDMF